ERLARLEETLSQRRDRPEPSSAPKAPSDRRLQERLRALSESRTPALSDRMPANPAEAAPLVDPGFGPVSPPRRAPEVQAGRTAPLQPETPAPAAPRVFDPASIERPPRPQSSFAASGTDPFAPAEPAIAAAPVVSQSNTSTFVAAARRAQRARQEAAAGGSIFARALARTRPAVSAEKPEPASAPAPEAEEPAGPLSRFRRKKAEEPAAPPPLAVEELEDAAATPGFITRHRR